MTCHCLRAFAELELKKAHNRKEYCFCKADCRQNAEVNITLTGCCKVENTVWKTAETNKFLFHGKAGISFKAQCTTGPQKDTLSVLMMERWTLEEAACSSITLAFSWSAPFSHIRPFCTQAYFLRWEKNGSTPFFTLRFACPSLSFCCPTGAQRVIPKKATTFMLLSDEAPTAKQTAFLAGVALFSPG